MDKSLSYQIYKKLVKIYTDSKIINFFSTIFSKIFNIVVNSRTFLLIANPRSTEIIKNSFIYKKITWFLSLVTTTLNRDFIMNTIDNSFFVGIVRDVLNHKEKNSINNLLLIPIIMLAINMSIKIIMGEFTFIGNRYFIGLFFLLTVMYYLQLDYWSIIKQSKVVSLTYNLLYDEPMDDHF